MKAKITFYGVRGGIARPGLDSLLFGGNTACVTLEYGKDIIIFDTGTGSFDLGRRLQGGGKKVSATILYSHYHWDHLIGLPFFAPMFEKKNSFLIAGKKGLKGALDKLLSPPNFPITLKELKAGLRFKEISEGSTLKIGKISVKPFFVNHPNGALGFRIELPSGKVVVHISDNAPAKNDAHLLKMIDGADVLIHDSQYLPKEFLLKKRFGHSPFNYTLDLANKCGIKTAVMFHHDPARNDREMERLERSACDLATKIGLHCKVMAAREGMELTI